jgi:hypothetical protein
MTLWLANVMDIADPAGFWAELRLPDTFEVNLAASEADNARPQRGGDRVGSDHARASYRSRSTTDRLDLISYRLGEPTSTAGATRPR